MPSSTSPRARSGVIIGVKPSRDQQLDRVLLQRELQQHGFVLEEVEAVPGDAGAAFEVDQVELLAERDVVERWEAERPDVDACRGGLPCSHPRRRSGASGCVRFGIAL